ncbi:MULTISPECIES: tyrosine-type recombinase/integrase [Diaphorobacter]|uniref:tyrosine-type recombinase/integrase n=1 Tax=Diaphorobacter TaxID=238749 RepID=UPI0000DCA754|nr:MULTISPECIES: site-specific integrase [Diaphorobacter]ABM41167.1 phage integrase family protein [Acidovorax sp. JS42]POR12168.1 integrase [Diaphorobacter sp. LR2014-1]QPN30493.1 tyrosine-type recombinase/integrase [Diaphorobacter sp. JS3051]TFI48247.1 site-specific integrase [Diaphorobacter sp. DS2]
MGKLSDVQIRAWIKAGERFEGRADGDGLYLRWRPSVPTPEWRFRYQFDRKPRVMSLGTYGVLSLAEARRTAKELSARVALGYDVASEKQDRIRETAERIEADRSAWTVADMADAYFRDKIMGHWKHPNIVRSRIENDIKPRIGKMKIEDVTTTDIDDVLKSIIKRGAPTVASDVLRWLKRMFNYAIKQRPKQLQRNPALPFDINDAGGKEESRDRWLSRDELCRLFEAMREAAGRFTIENHCAIRLLLLLAVRKEELLAAPWAEFDLDTGVWHLPAGRTKTGAATDIPLSPYALEILRELQRLAAGSAWVFPAVKMQTRMTPHRDPNTLNAAFSKHIRPLLPDVPHFVIHDLRRTARTHLSALGVEPHIAERCLNHKQRGVKGIYDRHAYFDERKAALNAWASLLQQIEMGNVQPNVLPLRKAAA